MKNSLCKKWIVLGAGLLLAGGSLFSAERVRAIPVPDGGAGADAKVDAAGNIHLIWVARDDVWYAKSSDTGRTFSREIRVNSEPGSAHPPKMFRGPELALGAKGQVHAIWYISAYQRKLPKDQWGVTYSHLDAGRGAFVSSINLNHQPCDNFSLAADGKGRVAVLWMAGKVFLNQSLNDGETFSEAQPVSEADPCECCASRTLFAADGTLEIAYRDKAANQRDMFVLASPKPGAPFSKSKLSPKPWSVNACPMTSASLAVAGKGLVSAWETKGEIAFARLDMSGQTQPPGAIIGAPKGKWPLALSAPDGTALLSWKEGATLRWQLYDPAGQPLGAPGSAVSSNPDRHTGVVTAAGDFVLFR